MTAPSSALSIVRMPEVSGIIRDCPRPVPLRNTVFGEQFDWDTVFYDVYRLGKHIVFQGPPLFNFFPVLQQSDYFKRGFSGFFPCAKSIERNRAQEIWLRDDSNAVILNAPFALGSITVQPNRSDLFKGKRVLHTLSKDNDIHWIIDWIRFYVHVHKADAVLLYDNNSTLYNSIELQAELRATFPDIVIHIVHWPFKYGPQGGMAGAVNGIEAPWDSDYCQTGSMQHARFKYLLHAKSVLNVDIDELVLSNRNRSIFEATESSWSGFIKFNGQWISRTTPTPVPAQQCRHGDFWLRDTMVEEVCPPKWCIRGNAGNHFRHSWSVHNLFGARANRKISSEFVYRHVKGISNNWKYSRWDNIPYDNTRFTEDTSLKAALSTAGLRQESNL